MSRPANTAPAAQPGPDRALTLLTDFGTTDYYVAAVKGVLLQRAPGVTLVDLSHDLRAGDVPGAAWLLAAAARWYAPGTVHLAVVDPGVGSERRILAAVASGAYYVAPDNGLLSRVLSGDPEATIIAVERPDLYLPGPGATFAGRDRFAPVAAFLASGGQLDDLGPVIEDPVRLPIEPPRAEGAPPQPDLPGGRLHGRVDHVDRYGNLITDLPMEWLGEHAITVEVAGRRGGSTSLRAGHFAEIPGGQAAALPGSLGTLELAFRDESLAGAWDVRRGDRVTVGFEALAGAEKRTAMARNVIPQNAIPQNDSATHDTETT